MNIGKLIKGQRGVSLLELSVSMGVTALIFGPLMATTYILLAAPQVTATQASTTTQITNTSQWLSNDINSGQSIVTGQQDALASVGGTDYTGTGTIFGESALVWDQGNIDRNNNQDGQFTSTVTASRFVDNPDSVSIAVRGDISPDLIETTMTWSADVPGGKVEQQETFLNYMRSPLRKKPVGGYVMFATKDIDVSGGKGVAIGNIHANEILSFEGADRRVAGFVESQGTVDISGDKGVYDFINSRVASLPMPVSFDAVDFAPYQFDFIGDVDLNDHPEVWLDFSQRKLLPGVYHATGKLDVDGKNLTGTVTFIANEIEIDGSKARLTAFKDGLLFFAQGTGERAVDISGSKGRLKGVIYAPSGEVELSGSKRKFDGSIFAENIKIKSADGWYAYAQEMFPQATAVLAITAALPPEDGDGGAPGTQWLAFTSDSLLRPQETPEGR